jgi:hypothetical protein
MQYMAHFSSCYKCVYPLTAIESFHLSLHILTYNVFTIPRQNNFQIPSVCSVVVFTLLQLHIDSVCQCMPTGTHATTESRTEDSRLKRTMDLRILLER